MDKSARMKELVEILNEASKAYYAKDEEIMSNFEYDTLYDELVKLEEETGVTLANSPTVNVGYEAVDELPKEAHEKPMLSLAKTKSREELRDWLNGKEALLLPYIPFHLISLLIPLQEMKAPTLLREPKAYQR